MTGRKLLIINRGAIAAQIRDIALDMGFEVHLVYQNEDCSHLKPSIRAHAIPSYMDEEAILSLIKVNGIDWVHPGYGFLSELGSFAAKVVGMGCGWVGPNPKVIADFEDKYQTKCLAQALKIPVLLATTAVEAVRQWQTPIMVKAKCGGGGRGMRLVHDMKDLDEVVELVAGEARERFNNDALFFEPYIQAARHIEVQLLADHQGRVVAIGDRDCSVQRRHQKVIEMAPALGLSQDERRAMHEDAIKLGQAVGLSSCATVEFLFDAKNRQHWLIEVNPRIQVEHEVTEKVTKVNLIEWQLNIALGGCIPDSLCHINPHGYAIQARVYAENPAEQYALCFGQLQQFTWNTRSPNITFRSNAQAGDLIDGRFDPMLLKVIAVGQDPEAAQGLLIQGLRQLQVVGITTNRDALIQWVSDIDWEALPNTQWLDQQIFKPNQYMMRLAQSAVLFLEAQLGRAPALRSIPNGWCITGSQWFHSTYQVVGQDTQKIQCRWIDNEALLLDCGLHIQLVEIATNTLTLLVQGERHAFHWIQLDDDHWSLINETTSVWLEKSGRELGGAKRVNEHSIYKALLPGRVVASAIQPGSLVHQGETLFVVEAMKMHHEIKADRDARVGEVYVQVNDFVQQNQSMFKWELDDVEA